MRPARQMVYLAGPDVFLSDVLALTVEKKQICARYGLTGVFPTDGLPHPTGPADTPAYGHLIAAHNESLILDCDAVIANLTPWHGPSADVGTVYEVGYARGLGKVVVGYSNDARSFVDRVRAAEGNADVYYDDPHFGCRRNLCTGHMLEDFGPTVRDNIMLDHAVRSGGPSRQFAILAGNKKPEDKDYYTDLTAFSAAVQLTARMLTQRRALQPL